jgi:hypothetical protein
MPDGASSNYPPRHPKPLKLKIVREKSRENEMHTGEYRTNYEGRKFVRV